MQTILGRTPLRHWPLFAFSFLCPLLFLVLSAAPVRAETGNLSIELNKAEDRDGNCVATFVVENGLGQQLDRFNLDLFVFDSKGVISRQVLLDLAPLRKDKTTVARFVLTDDACADTAKVLVNDIPACRASDGQELDCLKNLAVFSRSRIQLVK
jgi:hypothetical protein